jgi:hypothetical protein
MGGAVSDAWKNAGRAVESIPVIGHGARIGMSALSGFGLTDLVAADDRAIQGTKTILNAPRDAARAAASAQQQQIAAQRDMQNTLLSQPKNITPDNFLSQKTAQLANLRLGIASTMTGGGGAPAPVLGSPSLQGSYPGKAKFGQ